MMYEDEQGRIVDFLTGVALGALLGAGIALLLAPESGTKTRRKIVRVAEDLGDAASDRLQSAARDVRRAADDARKAAERSGSAIRETVRRGT